MTGAVQFAATHYAILMFLAGAGVMSGVTLAVVAAGLAWISRYGVETGGKQDATDGD